MALGFRWTAATAGLVFLAAPRAALGVPNSPPDETNGPSPPAKTSESGLTTVDPRAHGVALAPEPARPEPVPTGSTHVFDAFREHAERMRSVRLAGAGSSLILGGAFVATGLVAEQAWDETYGTVLWVTGAVTVVGGGLALVFPTTIEKTADDYGVYFTKAPTPEQEAALEHEWAEAADEARSARHLGAGISFAFSAIAVGAGIAVLASDAKEEPRHIWGTVLLAGGGAFAAGGVATLVLESPTESAYAAFMAARGKQPKVSVSRAPVWRVSATPLPSGGFVGVSAVF